ncbi:MAG: plasmid mobilization relaxosome protein MobC [Acutalibacter sp.]|nr:plasmid mobilization relaxosome protein MobC [Acutalibacter sp.]
MGVWLDEAEYQHLQKQQEITSLSVSALVRKSILGVEVRRRPHDTYTALLRELSAIGNNVNQIAYWANVRKSISENEITETIGLIQQAWKLVKNDL